MEYFQKLAETCNASEEMKKTGMSVTMIYEITDMTMPSGDVARYFLKFDKGSVVEVREAKPGEEVDMQYIAKKEIYGRMFTGKLKGEDAMKTGWLKCNYKLGKMLRYGAAFNVFNKIISSVPAEY
jgi:putative sterol carrier protein